MRILGNNGSVQQTVSTGYGEDGRIVSAGFVYGGAQKLFTYNYLPGSHLLQSLVKPNNMTLTLSYEDKRDLLIGMLYKRSNTQVASRSYTYDTLGRPTSRGTTRDGQSVSDSFAYNNRSELTSATVSGESYAYDYDNIGNRETAQEAAETVTAYATNSLNQYTAIGDFVPTFDDAGNQTLVKTSTGIWTVTYDAENRPTLFSNADGSTTVECTYDYMGRRATKKVTVNGSVTLHQRYIYRGYLQIACCDLTRTAQTALWLLTWDPTQTTATRPLAIQINGTWFTYGWDLTKNICEVYGQHGYIRTAYTYTPYGSVTMSGDLIQPIQWSSEYHDTELALVYYNYRHYNPTDGRWLGRDILPSYISYVFARNMSVLLTDFLGCFIWPFADQRQPHEREIENPFILLPYYLQDLCHAGCCSDAFSIRVCEQQAIEIGNRIIQLWEDNYGKGNNKGEHNYGGYLCWDWAMGFYKTASESSGDKWHYRYRQLFPVGAREYAKGERITTHFYTTLCACNRTRNSNCCIHLDDGFIWDNGYIHQEEDWYGDNWEEFPVNINNIDIKDLIIR